MSTRALRSSPCGSSCRPTACCPGATRRTCACSASCTRRPSPAPASSSSRPSSPTTFGTSSTSRTTSSSWTTSPGPSAWTPWGCRRSTSPGTRSSTRAQSRTRRTSAPGRCTAASWGWALCSRPRGWTRAEVRTLRTGPGPRAPRTSHRGHPSSPRTCLCTPIAMPCSLLVAIAISDQMSMPGPGTAGGQRVAGGSGTLRVREAGRALGTSAPVH
mmetsp:Transcript_17238/g.57830  ORF Transcript_17238/g.57830 Transcript_17238/m.57830 type:complete len:215 (+) Transcript_17238:396-1040(+)